MKKVKVQQIKHKLGFQEILNQIQKKEDIAFFSDCVKFRDYRSTAGTLDRAIQYLFLKKQNVSKQDALVFGKRKLCKVDSTRVFDGPASARILKTQKQTQGMINGWYNGRIEQKYDLGDEYKVEFKKDELLNDVDELHQQENDEIEENQKNLDYINKYFNELNEKYSFGGAKNTQKLMSQLLELRVKNKQRNETPLEYVEIEGQRFFHILNDIQDYLDKKIKSKSIVQDMRAFQSLTSLDRKLKVKYLPLGEPMVPQKEDDVKLNRKQTIAFSQERMRSFRKRACTQLFTQKFNKSNQMFKIADVPTMTQQQKINKFQDMLKQWQENGNKTPKDIEEPDKSKIQKITKQESQAEEISLFCTQKDVQLKKSRFSGSTLSLARKRGSTYQISDMSQSTRKLSLFEQRMNRFASTQISNINQSPQQLDHIDTDRLRQKYESLQSQREKEVNRIFRRNSNIEVGNKNLFKII